MKIGKNAEIFSQYWENTALLDLIPKEIVKWQEEIVLENYKRAKNESAIEKIIHKVRHIESVVEAGIEIMDRTKDLNWDKQKGIIICFLHDIGRFQQAATLDTFRDSNVLDHGDLGCNLVLEKGLKEMADSIKWHNKKEYLGNDIYSKLVRDADKLGLFKKSFESLIRADDPSENTSKDLSNEVLEEFLKEKIVDNKLAKSDIDWCLQRAGWIWDLNFEVSREMCRELGIPEKFKQEIEKANIDKKSLSLIAEKFDNF